MRINRLILLPAGLACLIHGQVPTPIRKADSPMSAAKLATIPEFTLPPQYKDRTAFPLPASVDNSKKKYMPPWKWEIQGLSCGNAAAVAYTYTYAVQASLDVATTGTIPRHTYEYTYHFLNQGDDAGDAWMFVEAFDILKETGAPTSEDFGGFEWGNAFTGWMSGYDKYHRAMQLRADQYYKVDAKTMAGIEAAKQYLHDQGNGSAAGGLLVFQAGAWEEKTVGGRTVFYQLDGDFHSIPILGYDDAFQGGSFLVTDNYGTTLAWVAYKEFLAGGAIAAKNGSWLMFPRVKKDYRPKFTFKVTMTHDQRGKIAILTGAAKNPQAAAPEKSKDYAGAFNYAGGNFPMGGKNRTSTLEFGLDLTDFSSLVTGTEARFFLQVVSKGGTGRIDKVSLMDYTGAVVREIPGTEINKTIAPNAVTTVSIPWTSGTVGIKAAAIAPGGKTPGARFRDLRGRALRGDGSAAKRAPGAVSVGPDGLRR